MFQVTADTTVPPVLVVLEAVAAIVTELKFSPGVSKSRVICWTPAASVKGTVTLVQFCQPPVAGIATETHTLLVVLKPTCMVAPDGDATRSCAV